MRVAATVCMLGLAACAHAPPAPKPVAEVPMYTPGEPMTARSTDLEDRNKPLAHAKEGDSTRKFSVDSTTTFSDGHGNMREVTPWFGTGRARYWAEMQKESLPPPKP